MHQNSLCKKVCLYTDKLNQYLLDSKGSFKAFKSMTYQEKMDLEYAKIWNHPPVYKDIIRRYLGQQIETEREAVLKGLLELAEEIKEAG